MKTYEFLKIDIQNKIATLTLNNPKKANALNATLWYELGEAIGELDSRDDVNVCVLRGEGKHFSSGIDLAHLQMIMEKTQEKSEEQQNEFLYEMIKKMQAPLSAFQNCKIPVIAAVHGVCVGAALDLITACDLRFCTFNSYFSILETKLGIVADMGTLQRISFLVSDTHVKEMAFTSKIFNGWKAHRWGLVNGTYPTKSWMLKKAYEMAKLISEMPAHCVQGSKSSINFSRENTVAAGLESIARLNSVLLLDPRTKEAFQSIKK